MKKFSKLVLCLFMMITCFNICSVYAEGEETTDQPTQQESEENGSPSDDSDIDLQSDGPGEAVTDGAILVESTGNKYNSITEAISAAESDDTVTLLNDVIEYVEINKNITIDLNGHTLTANKVPNQNGSRAIVTENGVELTIKSSATEKGTITGATAGAVRAKGLLNVDNVIFKDNSINVGIDGRTKEYGTGNDGGAIFVRGLDEIEVNISNCQFNGNKSQDSGGAVFIGGNVNLTMTNTTFNGNYAQMAGGAISISADDYSKYTPKNVKITQCNFNENSSQGTGGALAVQSGDNVLISESKFTNNQARSSGGAINNKIANFKTSQCNFTSNQAYTTKIGSSNGGAIYSWTDYIDEGSTFTGNYAKNEGGAIYIRTPLKNKTSMADISSTTIITGNSAGKYGGGISNYGELKMQSGSTLYNNSADSVGADIYNKGTLTLNTVGSNWILNDDNHLIDGWYYDGYYKDDTTEEKTRWNVSDEDSYTRELDFGNQDTITVGGNSQIIALKAAHDIYRGYHVQYLDADTNEEIAEATSFSDIRVGTTIKVSAAEVEGYEFESVVVGNEVETVDLDDDSETSNETNTSKDVELVIDKDESKNVITFYYKALRNYTVNYVDKDSNESIGDSKIVENIKVGTEVSEDAVSVDGYTLDGDSSAKLVVDKDDSKNVITFYYTKNADPTPAPTTTPTPTDTPTSTPNATSTPVTTPASTPVANNTTPATPVTPTRRTTPVTPITPVVTPTATPEATVEPTATPEATSTPSATPTVINDDETPEAAVKGHWALINLVCALLSVLLGVIVILSKRKKDEEEDEDEQVVESEEDDEETSTRHRRWKVVAGIDAIVSVVVFIFTENITLPMQLVDKWTILMVVFLLVSVVSTYFARKWHEEDEDDESSENA